MRNKPPKKAATKVIDSTLVDYSATMKRLAHADLESRVAEALAEPDEPTTLKTFHRKRKEIADELFSPDLRRNKLADEL